MNKKFAVPAIVIPIILLVLFYSFEESDVPIEELESEENNAMILESKTDIIMPNKSSRPGCEETDSCYIPSTFAVNVGETVTWTNNDVAFHSVTSGSYENPEDLFDSGHMDPDQSFSYTFAEEGEYDFFCTLHPWMKGKILVEN